MSHLDAPKRLRTASGIKLTPNLKKFQKKCGFLSGAGVLLRRLILCVRPYVRPYVLPYVRTAVPSIIRFRKLNYRRYGEPKFWCKKRYGRRTVDNALFWRSKKLRTVEELSKKKYADAPRCPKNTGAPSMSAFFNNKHKLHYRGYGEILASTRASKC